ncbi:MAG: DUF1318 domain-containing protein [Candidatus Sumerlaeia bacterium]
MRYPILAARFVLAAGVMMLAACSGNLLQVDVFVVGERSSLEKQVLGTYRSLGDDFQAYGSVRGVDEDGQIRVPPPITESKQVAIRAMQNRAYNRDDVSEFLSRGLVGENRDGMLEIFEERLANQPGVSADFLRLVVREENQNRQTILERLIQTSPGVEAGQDEKIRSIFASLNRDAAPQGARVQMEDGSWIVK